MRRPFAGVPAHSSLWSGCGPASHAEQATRFAPTETQRAFLGNSRGTPGKEFVSLPSDGGVRGAWLCAFGMNQDSPDIQFGAINRSPSQFTGVTRARGPTQQDSAIWTVAPDLASIPSRRITFQDIEQIAIPALRNLGLHPPSPAENGTRRSPPSGNLERDHQLATLLL